MLAGEGMAPVCATPDRVMRGIPSVVVAVVLAGCAGSPPPAEPSAVSVSAPPTEPPETETPTPTRSDVPETPWSVSYHDGSGNAFQFERAEESASYTYSPVTPERSSTGMYSGGNPAAGPLGEEQVAELWKRLLELEAATAAHTEERGKGTGAFRIVTPVGERSFIVERGDLLKAFDEFLAALKTPQK